MDNKNVRIAAFVERCDIVAEQIDTHPNRPVSTSITYLEHLDGTKKLRLRVTSTYDSRTDEVRAVVAEWTPTGWIDCVEILPGNTVVIGDGEGIWSDTVEAALNLYADVFRL